MSRMSKEKPGGVGLMARVVHGEFGTVLPFALLAMAVMFLIVMFLMFIGISELTISREAIASNDALALAEEGVSRALSELTNNRSLTDLAYNTESASEQENIYQWPSVGSGQPRYYQYPDDPDPEEGYRVGIFLDKSGGNDFGIDCNPTKKQIISQGWVEGEGIRITRAVDLRVTYEYSDPGYLDAFNFLIYQGDEDASAPQGGELMEFVNVLGTFKIDGTGDHNPQTDDPAEFDNDPDGVSDNGWGIYSRGPIDIFAGVLGLDCKFWGNVASEDWVRVATAVTPMALSVYDGGVFAGIIDDEDDEPDIPSGLEYEGLTENGCLMVQALSISDFTVDRIVARGDVMVTSILSGDNPVSMEVPEGIYSGRNVELNGVLGSGLIGTMEIGPITARGKVDIWSVASNVNVIGDIQAGSVSEEYLSGTCTGAYLYGDNEGYHDNDDPVIYVQDSNDLRDFEEEGVDWSSNPTVYNMTRDCWGVVTGLGPEGERQHRLIVDGGFQGSEPWFDNGDIFAVISSTYSDDMMVDSTKNFVEEGVDPGQSPTVYNETRGCTATVIGIETIVNPNDALVLADVHGGVNGQDYFAAGDRYRMEGFGTPDWRGIDIKAFWGNVNVAGSIESRGKVTLDAAGSSLTTGDIIAGNNRAITYGDTGGGDDYLGGEGVEIVVNPVIFDSSCQVGNIKTNSRVNVDVDTGLLRSSGHVTVQGDIEAGSDNTSGDGGYGFRFAAEERLDGDNNNVLGDISSRGMVEIDTSGADIVTGNIEAGTDSENLMGGTGVLLYGTSDWWLWFENKANVDVGNIVSHGSTSITQSDGTLGTGSITAGTDAAEDSAKGVGVNVNSMDTDTTTTIDGHIMSRGQVILGADELNVSGYVTAGVDYARDDAYDGYGVIIDVLASNGSIVVGGITTPGRVDLDTGGGGYIGIMGDMTVGTDNDIDGGGGTGYGWGGTGSEIKSGNYSILVTGTIKSRGPVRVQSGNATVNAGDILAGGAGNGVGGPTGYGGTGINILTGSASINVGELRTPARVKLDASWSNITAGDIWSGSEQDNPDNDGSLGVWLTSALSHDISTGEIWTPAMVYMDQSYSTGGGTIDSDKVWAGSCGQNIPDGEVMGSSPSFPVDTAIGHRKKASGSSINTIQIDETWYVGGLDYESSSDDQLAFGNIWTGKEVIFEETEDDAVSLTGYIFTSHNTPIQDKGNVHLAGQGLDVDLESGIHTAGNVQVRMDGSDNKKWIIGAALYDPDDTYPLGAIDAEGAVTIIPVSQGGVDLETIIEGSITAADLVIDANNETVRVTEYSTENEAGINSQGNLILLADDNDEIDLSAEKGIHVAGSIDLDCSGSGVFKVVGPLQSRGNIDIEDIDGTGNTKVDIGDLDLQEGSDVKANGHINIRFKGGVDSHQFFNNILCPVAGRTLELICEDPTDGRWGFENLYSSDKISLKIDNPYDISGTVWAEEAATVDYSGADNNASQVDALNFVSGSILGAGQDTGSWGLTLKADRVMGSGAELMFVNGDLYGIPKVTLIDKRDHSSSYDGGVDKTGANRVVDTPTIDESWKSPVENPDAYAYPAFAHDFPYSLPGEDSKPPKPDCPDPMSGAGEKYMGLDDIPDYPDEVPTSPDVPALPLAHTPDAPPVPGASEFPFFGGEEVVFPQPNWDYWKRQAIKQGNYYGGNVTIGPETIANQSETEVYYIDGNAEINRVHFDNEGEGFQCKAVIVVRGDIDIKQLNKWRISTAWELHLLAENDITMEPSRKVKIEDGSEHHYFFWAGHDITIPMTTWHCVNNGVVRGSIVAGNKVTITDPFGLEGSGLYRLKYKRPTVDVAGWVMDYETTGWNEIALEKVDIDNPDSLWYR